MLPGACCLMYVDHFIRSYGMTYDLSNVFPVAQEVWIIAFLKLILFVFTRKLHCTRNYIHMNLFVSFILRAMAVISKEIVLYIMYSKLPKDDPGWNFYSISAVKQILAYYSHIDQIRACAQPVWPCNPCGDNVHLPKQFASETLTFYISQQIALICKFSKVCMEYFVACNYFWLLVEAIFLHTLLFTAVLTKRHLLKKYMLLGWGNRTLTHRCFSDHGALVALGSGARGRFSLFQWIFKNKMFVHRKPSVSHSFK